MQCCLLHTLCRTQMKSKTWVVSSEKVTCFSRQRHSNDGLRIESPSKNHLLPYNSKRVTFYLIRQQWNKLENNLDRCCFCAVNAIEWYFYPYWVRCHSIRMNVPGVIIIEIEWFKMCFPLLRVVNVVNGVHPRRQRHQRSLTKNALSTCHIFPVVCHFL